MSLFQWLTTSLVASFLGSLHCAAMCGGLVSAMGLATEAVPRGWGIGRLAWAFHLGRLCVYALLGASAGALGKVLNVAGAHTGVMHAAALVAGGLVLLVGLVGLAAQAGVRLPSLPTRLGTGLARVVQHIRPSGVRGAFALGLAASLLPCGWLYAFVISSAATGSVLGGALVMAAFWLGGIPTLLGLGSLVSRLAVPLRRHVPLLSAALLVCLGLGAILGRVNVPAVALGHASATLTNPGQAPPCH